MIKELNIDEEFEKILPPTKHESLFDDSDDYQSLREYIISQPLTVYYQPKLPFRDIKVIDYLDFKWEESVSNATLSRRHLFFIKQSERGAVDYCNAFGYYDKTSSKFVVLPYSFIVNNSYGLVPYSWIRRANKNIDKENRYITGSLTFNDASVAATFVLGQKAGLEEWVDRRGKGLLAYYPELAEKPSPEVVEQDIWPLEKKEEPSSRHLFHIIVPGVCEAKGYFDQPTGHFYILKNSLLNLKVDKEYEETASGKARKRLIDSVCTKTDFYYLVNKDAKCRTASAAAAYVLGKDASYVEWEDDDNKALMDFYPSNFFTKKSLLKASASSGYPYNQLSSPERSSTIHLFYISRLSEVGRYCHGIGFYDENSQMFILKEGSKWSFNVTPSFERSSDNLVRKQYIKQFCKLSRFYYIQTRDIICNSPNVAASIVLGEPVNGWLEWKDNDGKNLHDVYWNAGGPAV